MKSTWRNWRAPVALVVLSLVPALAGTARLAEVAGGGLVTPANQRFFATPLPLLIHIPAAIVFSMLGAFQFSSVLRRHRRWHRIAGRVLIPCAILTAGSGLWMTVSYPWAPGDGLAVYIERLFFGTAMLGSVVLGLAAIRRGHFADHGEWMIRAYAVGLGAGTQVLTHLPWFILVDRTPSEVPRAIMMGLGWGINILVAEGLILRTAQRRTVEARQTSSKPPQLANV